MKTNIIISLGITMLFGTTAFSQVGINTQSPEATLDIRGKNHNGAVTATDGILVPRVNALATSGSVNGQLVYLIADTAFPAFTKGFYYWNGSAWTGFSDGSAVGDSSPDDWMDVDNSGTTGEPSTIYSSRQVGIGNSSPSRYAKLQVYGSNQGILLPSVNLTSNTLDLNADQDNSVANQPIGLLVFNDGITLAKGYYFWNGTEWRTIDNSTAVAPAITDILCANSTLYPKSYTAGTPYAGTLTIPYSGGNGGSYSAGTPVTVNGLTFTLQAGKLNMGSGSLSFSVVGNNPTVSSPTTTTLPVSASNVSFFTGSCNAVVGDNNAAAELTAVAMGPLVSNSDNGVSGYSLTATSPDGKYSIRLFAKSGYKFGEANVQIRSNAGTPTITWQNENNYVNLDGGAAGIWNLGNNASTFPVANEWCGSTNATGENPMTRITANTSSYGTVAFGDAGVGDGGRVEYRRYTWTSTNSSDKTMYDVRVMMGTPDMTKATNATNCPSGVCGAAKGFIKIMQISSN